MKAAVLKNWGEIGDQFLKKGTISTKLFTK